MLVRAVQRNGEDRACLPFEGDAGAGVVPHRGRAAAAQDQEHLLVEVMHRFELLAGRDLADIAVVGKPRRLVIDVHALGARAAARPRLQFDRAQVLHVVRADDVEPVVAHEAQVRPNPSRCGISPPIPWMRGRLFAPLAPCAFALALTAATVAHQSTLSSQRPGRMPPRCQPPRKQSASRCRACGASRSASRPSSSCSVAAPYVDRAVLPVRRSGLDADAVALGDRGAGRARVACRSIASRRRCRSPSSSPRTAPSAAIAASTSAPCARRWNSMTTPAGSAAPRPSPSRPPRTCSSGRAAASSAKVLEIPLAVWLYVVLPKRRVLEIYLNIAQWGPNGEFGAEAGARYAFGKSARNLNAREAAELAAILPNPGRRSARAPSTLVRQLCRRLRAPRRSLSGAQCLRALRAAPAP